MRRRQIVPDPSHTSPWAQHSWLVLTAILRMATNRLSFVDADRKMFLGDVCFLLTLILAILVL